MIFVKSYKSQNYLSKNFEYLDKDPNINFISTNQDYFTKNFEYLDKDPNINFISKSQEYLTKKENFEYLKVTTPTKT